MKYLVMADCYALNRLWLKDEIAELPEGTKVPKHFKQVKSIAEKVMDLPAPEEKKEPEALEAMSINQLRSLAKSNGIEVTAKMKKVDIITAIRGE